VTVGSWLGVLALYVLVLWQLNVRPNKLPNSAAYYLFGGNANCLAGEFPNLDFACDANGHPSGLIIAFGYPHVWLAAAVEWATPLDTLNAVRLVWATTLLIALVGARRLFGLVGSAPWVAWVGAALFLVSPIVANQSGYGPLQLGFALVPCYVLTDRWFITCMERRRYRLVAACVVVAIRSFALFTDGYSFVMSLVPIAVLYVIWGVRWVSRSGAWRMVAVASGTALFSIASAYFLYTRYVGVEEFDEVPMDFFRGQGVDLFALAVPPASSWVFRALGWHHTIEASQAYSDGRNLGDVYLGWSLVAAAIGGLVVAYRRRRGAVTLLPFVVAGAVGFLLALGPSLKIADFRPSEALLNGVPAASVYFMSSDAATAPTGLGWLYRLPGIDTMRALYRWELLVRLGLLLLAMIAVSKLMTRGRALAVAGFVVLALITADTLTSPFDAHRRGVGALARVEQFTTDVVDPLVGVVGGGERVVLVNPAPQGSGTNFYLANWICPRLDVRCYNVGGDKGGALAAADQPPAVLQVMFSTDDLENRIDALFSEHLVDAVILVAFDMRADAYAWPPADAAAGAARDAAETIVGSGRFEADRQQWTTVLRPRPS
jgi:hypothetical protein